MSKKQRSVLNKAKDYYEKHKEKLREQARNKYRNLPGEEKIKKREYGKIRYIKKLSLSDLLSDELNSKSSLIRFTTFLFLTSYLHSSKNI